MKTSDDLFALFERNADETRMVLEAPDRNDDEVLDELLGAVAERLGCQRYQLVVVTTMYGENPGDVPLERLPLYEELMNAVQDFKIGDRANGVSFATGTIYGVPVLMTNSDSWTAVWAAKPDKEPE